MKTDILIVGSGCSGLYCALHLPREKKVTIVTKSDSECSNSYLAQGGISVLRDDDDFDAFFEDTMKAGHYENNRESVATMISASRDVVDDLVEYGVEFSRKEDGTFNYTKEGAHSASRILFHKDITGKEITSKLLKKAKKQENISILEHTTLVDIIEKEGACIGAVVELEDGKLEAVSAECVVLACGGVGGLYKHSTNFRHLTGDAIAIAAKHGVKLKNMNYVQIHPTTFYSPNGDERSFLISESVRGEGAKLYNMDMERFVNELLPRDVVTKAIEKQMEQDGAEFVWEDLRTIPENELMAHFPNIVQHCKDNNYDVTTECIPVVPAQHYFMGGIWVDLCSKTSMEGLYAVGETACNGVHGRNRLASNSLLESLVFAKRAALNIIDNPLMIEELPEIDMSIYEDMDGLKDEYRKIVLNEIKKGEREDNKNV